MKKFSKKSAIILTVLLVVVLAVGFVFSFVPIQFGKHKFVSLSNTINVSTDLVGGMYGEYNITTENPTENDIVSTVSLIREVFEEDGYKNVNVYSVGNKKVRIELSYPAGESSYVTAYSKLGNVGTGAFSLASTSSEEEGTITIAGSKGVKDIKVYTNNDAKYITINFNDDGKAKYQQICESSTSIYLKLGEYSQSISLSGVTDYSSLTLSNTDWNNMISLEQKIKLGCTKVELDGSNAIINTMSATLSTGETASSPSEKSFFTSTVHIVSFSAVIIVAILILAIFAVKFGFFAVVALISMLLGSYLYLFIAWLVPSFELGLSVVLSLVIGIALIYTYAFNFAQNVKSEYNLGKSLQASLESSYKKSILGEIFTNIALLISSLILMALSFGELTSVAISFAILSAVNLFVNLCVIPFVVKIGISFNGFGRKLFLLKKRNSLVDLDGDTQSAEKEGK